MQNILNKFPAENDLLRWSEKLAGKQPLKVNGHLHSPYSFSAFTNMEQMFKMATNENIKVLGINDFNTTDGYVEFIKLAIKYKIFPLFNIEFMGMLGDEQANGIRVNDPNNPGRTYFSGKGLRYPAQTGEENKKVLYSIVNESHRQVEEMISNLNDFLQQIGSDIRIGIDEIRGKWAKELVRERHIAKALRIKIFEKFSNEKKRRIFLEKLLRDKVPMSLSDDVSALENEIRAKLLKKGGVAYAKENEKAFPEIEKVIEIIVNAGGIPCYPVLLDDKNGDYTEYESDPVKLLEKLKEKKVTSIELIPGRNDFKKLKEFVLFFDKNGFVITLGTEHNTPAMEPVTVSCREGKALDRELVSISYRGASVLAAHQYLHAQGREGYIRNDGTSRIDEKEYFEQLGDAVIRKFIS
ncbi:MAG: PHP domain-containing protein [Bacteroidales bacterium]|nr:PHP domain-containing protein [Bacteroidales bacterium]